MIAGLGPPEDQTVGLLLHSADDHQGPVEVAMGMPRRMSQRHEHFSGPAAVLANVFLDDGVPTEEVILVSDPFEEDVLCGEAQLSGKLEIILEDAVDDPGLPTAVAKAPSANPRPPG